MQFYNIRAIPSKQTNLDQTAEGEEPELEDDLSRNTPTITGSAQIEIAEKVAAAVCTHIRDHPEPGFSIREWECSETSKHCSTAGAFRFRRTSDIRATTS
jgi:hypothetical protein